MNVSWLDRTDWSLITMTGADRIDFLHRLSTNDLTNLKVEGGVQTVLLNEKARIIDVLAVLEFGDHSLLIASPGSAATVVQWLRKYVIMEDVRFRDITQETHMIEICGPSSALAVEGLLGADVGKLSLCHHITVDTRIVVRMPSFDEVSYWIIGNHEAMYSLFEVLNSNESTIRRMTEFEAEKLRIDAGLGKLGSEYSDQYNPLEAGLLHLTSFTKGCYLGQEVVARLDSYNKVKQRVMGFVGTSEVASGDTVMSEAEIIGKITSVSHQPETNEVRALGYVRMEHALPGSNVTIIHEGNNITMELRLLPMVN